jgi:hypothetical protein
MMSIMASTGSSKGYLVGLLEDLTLATAGIVGAILLLEAQIAPLRAEHRSSVGVSATSGASTGPRDIPRS